MVTFVVDGDGEDDFLRCCGQLLVVAAALVVAVEVDVVVDVCAEEDVVVLVGEEKNIIVQVQR